MEVVFVPICSVTRKQGYQEIQGQRREDSEAGGEGGRCDPSSERREGDWTTEMMDDTAASNTHPSSGIINSKQDDQYTSRMFPQLCYAVRGAPSQRGKGGVSY